MKRMIVGLLCALVTALAVGSAAQAADIKIGVAAALTGPIGKMGVPIKNGFILASEEINAKGGINGNKIVLFIEDEQAKKEEGMNVVKKFTFQDKVLAIFGPTTSGSFFAAGPIANQAKVVIFGTSTTALGISNIGPWAFRNAVMEADILPITVREAVKKFKIKKVAVIYGNDDSFTKSGYDVFKKVLEDQKIPVTNTETFARGDVDFRAQLTKIKAQKPDAIVCSAYVEEVAGIILQARSLGIKVPFIGGNGFNSAKLFELARDAADNSVMGSPWAAESKTPKNIAFVAAYTKKFGVEPDQFAAQSYDAMYIMAEALKTIKLTGNLEKDRLALRDALPAVKMEGATGSFAFRKAIPKAGEETGYDSQQAAHIFIAKGGKFVLMK
jgi:branched-chain amino acid transport system substrate-binding protein